MTLWIVANVVFLALIGWLVVLEIRVARARGRSLIPNLYEGCDFIVFSLCATVLVATIALLAAGHWGWAIPTQVVAVALCALKSHVEDFFSALDDRLGRGKQEASPLGSLIQKLESGCSVVDSNTKSALSAARMLGQSGDSRAIKPLTKVLRARAGHPEVCAAAADALGSLGDKSAVPALIAVLHDSPERERACAMMIGALMGPSALDLSSVDIPSEGKVTKKKNDAPLGVLRILVSIAQIREAAARSLGGLGDSRAVKHLIRSLRDEWPPVRDAAADSLKQIGGTAATRALRSYRPSSESDEPPKRLLQVMEEAKQEASRFRGVR